MEDYTYHLDPANPLVLGAHMLEICPSIASGKPKIEIHPLGIGGKEDPCRMVFDCAGRQGGQRARSSISATASASWSTKSNASPRRKPLPKLPVARVLWKPLPDLKTATAAWIHAGGAHHTVLSYALTSEHLEDFAEMARHRTQRDRRATPACGPTRTNSARPISTITSPKASKAEALIARLLDTLHGFTSRELMR